MLLKKPQPGESLAESKPHVAALWDVNANQVTPYDIGPACGRTATWQCPQGHSWERRIVDQLRDGERCPECEAADPHRGPRKPRIGRSVGDYYPDLVEEWDTEANHPLTPFDVRPGCGVAVAWRCSNDHKWAEVVSRRVRNSPCPQCATSSGVDTHA